MTASGSSPLLCYLLHPAIRLQSLYCDTMRIRRKREDSVMLFLKYLPCVAFRDFPLACSLQHCALWQVTSVTLAISAWLAVPTTHMGAISFSGKRIFTFSTGRTCPRMDNVVVTKGENYRPRICGGACEGDSWRHPQGGGGLYFCGSILLRSKMPEGGATYSGGRGGGIYAVTGSTAYVSAITPFLPHEKPIPSVHLSPWLASLSFSGSWVTAARYLCRGRGETGRAHRRAVRQDP